MDCNGYLRLYNVGSLLGDAGCLPLSASRVDSLGPMVGPVGIRAQHSQQLAAILAIKVLAGHVELRLCAGLHLGILAQTVNSGQSDVVTKTLKERSQRP